MLTVKQVTLDFTGQVNGCDKIPVIGWLIESDQRNVIQKTWNLQLSTTESFSNVIFDSYIINSSESQNIIIPEQKLESSKKYFIRVRIESTTGEKSNWSPAAYFITGLFGEWQADFISAETAIDKDKSKGTYLRKNFTFPDKEKIESVYAHVSALGLYKLYVNGEKVGSDEMTPGWTSYHNQLLYQTYDITDSITSGVNTVAGSLGPGWFKGDMNFIRRRNNYGEQTALICQIVANYADGSRKIYATDASWSGTDSPVLFSEIYDGEIYDANLEVGNWNNIDCDTRVWRPVNVVNFDKLALRPQGTCTVKIMDKKDPIARIITPEGDSVLDFGQNLTGWVEFKVTGKAGDKVLLRHFEVLDAEGNVYLENLRSAKQTIDYTLNGNGEESYQPNFTFQGFRYVKIEAWPGNIALSSFKACVVHSDMDNTGTFISSNKDLNQLHSNILWGMKGNFLDVPTDCPQRDERLGWTGDAQIFCRTASYLMNTRNFFAKWLLDLGFDQTEEGGVPHVVPDILTGYCENDKFLSDGRTHSAAAWADAAVINPWTMYLMYGDTEVLKNQYHSMKSWIEFMRKHAVNNKWTYKLQFGDWVALDAREGSYFGATPSDLICMAFYSWSTLLFSKAAGVLGHEQDRQEYAQLHREIVQSFQDEFFTPTGRMAARTQTAHIVALYFNLVPEQHKQRTVDTLVELLDEHDGHLVTGFVGTPYLCHVLSDNGREDEAWKLLLKEDFPSWLYQVKSGATTIWEHWDGIKSDGTMWSPDMNSFNHYAYGAIGEWLYKRIGGIDTDEENPGFKHIIISPCVSDYLTWAETKYTSNYGDIIVNWNIISDKKSVVLHINIPPNSTATLSLPITAALINSDGISFTHNDNKLQGNVGSGKYLVEYKIH